VNAAIKRHLTPRKLSVVIITKRRRRAETGAGHGCSLRLSRCDGEKPSELLEEDRVIGALKLNIAEGDVRITPIKEVFAR
jgi:zinc protease